jgi:hypothetical protein
MKMQILPLGGCAHKSRRFRAGGWLIAATAAVTLFAVSPASDAAVISVNVNDSSAWAQSKGANSEAVFGFDYTNYGIPLAPGAASKTAMRLRANIGPTAAVQGVTVSPTAVSLTGDYRIEATVWMNTFGPFTGTASNGSGTTQFFGLGGGYSGGTNYRAGATVGDGSGTWFAVSNEGGFSNTSTTIRDYSAFIGSGAVAANFIIAPTAYSAQGATTAQDNANAYYTAFLPAVDVTTINGGALATAQNAIAGSTIQTGNGVAGGPLFAWRQFVIERTGGQMTFSLDGHLISTLSAATGAAPVTLDGGTSLTYFDATSGISGQPDLNFALVSSYTVITPEPGGLAVFGVVSGLMLVRRRR